MHCRPLRAHRRGDYSGGNCLTGTRSLAAFSLIELLATAVIIMVLFTMYWGGSSGARQKSRQALCAQNLQKDYIALDIFAREHAGKFPDKSGARTSAEALDALVPKYTADASGFICPASKDSPLPGGESIAKRQISYAYYMGRSSGGSDDPLLTDRQVDSKPKMTNQMVFSSSGKPPGNNHKNNGGNILFCDGHAAACPPYATFSMVLTQGVVLLNP